MKRPLQLEIQTADEWMILKGEDQFGPFSYSEVISLLQENSLHQFDYIWSSHLETWTPIADLAEFSADRIIRIVEKNDKHESFGIRKFDRKPIKLKAYCHNNKKLWFGQTESLSLGGAMITMENPLLTPDENIIIHFGKTTEDDNAINVSAQIITKKLIKQKIQHDTNIQYAVRFLNMSDEAKRQLQLWMNRNEK